MILKEFYMASERINARLLIAQGIPPENNDFAYIGGSKDTYLN